MNDEWWISWYSPHPMSTFEMHSPWWISGWACGPEGSFNVPIVVAAVRAADEDAAKAVIVAAYDVPPTDVRWRFCDDLEGRSPFSDRFPKAWWMAWDSERTCACPAHAPEQGRRPVSKPKWLDKHPCVACGTGYGDCASGARLGVKCCRDCHHPGRWGAKPYNGDDYREMYAGRDMPEWVAAKVRALDAPEQGDDR